MFEKLIESNSEGAEFKKRKSYFMVSSVVVGILIITAVVISIYAADYSLGNMAIELSQIVSPEEIAPADPEEVTRPKQPAAATVASRLSTRQVNMLRVDETPSQVPTGVSVTPNAQRARPNGSFVLGRFNTDVTSPGPIDRGTPTTTDGGGLVSSLKPSEPAGDDPEPPPPEIKRAAAAKRTVSKGVINGIAISLPKPNYTEAARAVGAHGQVQVQVTIDEDGRVMAANAISGNVLLRPEAERAARSARFTPTKLSDVPVKVTGVIIYNFTR